MRCGYCAFALLSSSGPPHKSLGLMSARVDPFFSFFFSFFFLASISGCRDFESKSKQRVEKVMKRCVTDKKPSPTKEPKLKFLKKPVI